MGYMGCAAFLQFLAILTAFGSIGFAILGISRDFWWNAELDRIRAQFTPVEEDLLRRNFYYLEIGFILLVLVGIIAISVHTYLCFHKYEQHFHQSKASKRMSIIIGVYMILISALVLYSASRYNSKLGIVEANDTRTYLYKVEELELDETVHYEKSKSIFYYCHWARGKPKSWARLKGLRIKKTGTHICQRYGSKILAAIMSIFVGILNLIFSFFLRSHRRDKEAAHVVMLYELFGDYEEARAEHFGQPFILKKYKDDLLTRNMEAPLTPKMKKFMHGVRVPVNDEEVYLFPDDSPFYNEEDFYVSEALKEDTKKNQKAKVNTRRTGLLPPLEPEPVHPFKNKVKPQPSKTDLK